MAADCIATAYGLAAHDALARAVAAAKAGDPLAAVTVVVPTNPMAVAARRGLARRHAAAVVAFVTPYRLADMLASARLAAGGKRPVSTPVLAGLVRSVLSDEPGLFSEVQTHPATERSLLSAYRLLSEVSADARHSISSADERAAEVVRIHGRVREELSRARFSDEQDLIDAAVAVLREGSTAGEGAAAGDHPAGEGTLFGEDTTLGEGTLFGEDTALGGDPPPGVAKPPAELLGAVIVFLPQRLGPGHARLLRAVGERLGLTVIAGVSGVEAADEAVHEAVAAIGASWPGDADSQAGADGQAAAMSPGAGLPVADQALSVSDADDEVRHAVRAVVQAARDGIALDRIAILYGSRDPYARLVAAALDSAGIAWFGDSITTTDSSLLGRSLLALLMLDEQNFSRHDVSAWLGGALVLGADGRPCPAAAWERASRAAGVVADPRQWQQRLTVRIDDLKAEAARLATDSEHDWLAEHRLREASEATELRSFIADLAGSLQRGEHCETWEELAAWCMGLISAYFGDSGPFSRRSRWPSHEQSAAERVEKAVEQLGSLDGIDPNPSPAAFRRALRAQLEADLGRRGRFGNGVFAGSVAHAVGLEFDQVVILGMAEGSMPPRQREDPLLGDRVRAVAGSELPPASHVVGDLHRALLAVMAASGHVAFTFPRGDLRRNTTRAPSRWLLDCAEARGEGRPAPDDIAHVTGDWFSEVPSFIAGMRQTEFPAHDHEYDVRSVLDHAESGFDPAASGVAESRIEVRRGTELLQGRLSERFTRFDGNLADGDLRGARLGSPTDQGQVFAASKLEAWVKCPHAYFVRHVLGVREVEDPEEQYRISPIDRGLLLHAVIEQWMTTTMAEAGFPRADDDAFRAAVAGLLGIAAEHFARIEDRGQAGRRLYWERDQRVMRADLEGFAEADRQLRAETGSTPLAHERRFGIVGSGERAVDIALPDGRTLDLRGVIDRVDRRADGGLHVIDYKTGRSDGYKDLSAQDPTLGGSNLQLGLYGLAAPRLAMPDAEQAGTVPVRSDYWFVGQREGNRRIGYEITADISDAVMNKVAAIVDRIAEGGFPQHPAKPEYRPWVDCHYCEPDGLGLAYQYGDWLRMQDDPAIVPYLEVISV